MVDCIVADADPMISRPFIAAAGLPGQTLKLE
jgi:hypothetical protein